MKLKAFIFLFFLPVILLSASDSSAQSAKIEDKPLPERLDQVISSDFSSDGPGVVLLVAKEGKVIYEKAFGKANLELNVPMSTGHVFRIASITKQFTAVAILQLIEKGQLQLDDDITKFIPDYPVHGYHISIANLLSHTSGIKDYTEMEMAPGALRQQHSVAELIGMFKDQAMEFEPGTAFKYSNSNYVLLGYIIEKLSGQTYEQYINEHIFVPLGMTHSYYDSAEKVIPGRLTGYMATGANTAVNAGYIDPSNVYAAGALLMTADDLFKWHQGLYRHTILKKEDLSLATTPFTLKNGKKTKYGFGWELDSLGTMAAIQHSGSINGFSSYEIYLPAQDIFVACFSNRQNISTQQPAWLAASITAHSPAVQDIQLTAAQKGLYIGNYKFKLDQPSTINIFEKDGKLFLYQTGYPHPWEMHFTKPAEFYCDEVFPIVHVFSFDSSGKVTGFVIHAPSYTSTITRIK